MEIFFLIILLSFCLLFYFSNPNNKVNRWCAVYVFFTWIGVFKEVFMYQIVPWLQTFSEIQISSNFYAAAYSVQTWIVYSFAAPTGIIMALYFINVDRSNPGLLLKLKVILYSPAILLTAFFTPLSFRTHQLGDPLFWPIYSVYNVGMGIAFIIFLTKGVRQEKYNKVKTQKMLFSLVILLPTIYCLITIYIIHPLGLTRLFKLWRGNAMIVIVCMSIFIVMAFKDGFMGLRFSSETYRWNSDMGIIHKGAEYTGHMLKNQTAKMEWCINNLKAQYDNTREKVPEELAILSRSIAAIKSYTDKARKYSGTICLAEEPCSLRTLLEDSFPSCPVQMDINISGDVYWVCDRMHMTEVFSNILSNAAEATQDSGVIEIHGGYDKNERFFLLSFTDHGVGMSKDDLGKMFTPYFTSKNTEKNFGLGLTYCKNVVERHGGRIHAESEMDKGTTVTIEFPRKKAAVSGGHEMEGQNG